MNIRRLAALAIIPVLLAVIAGTSRAVPPDSACASDAGAAASAAIANWRIAIGNGDADAVTALYDTNATLLTADPGRELRGRSSIADYYASLLQRHPVPRIESLSIATDCNSVTVEGTVLLRVTGVRKGTRMLLAGISRARLELIEGGWVIKRHELALEPRAIKPLVAF